MEGAQYELPYDLTFGSFILTIAHCHFYVPELEGKLDRGSETGARGVTNRWTETSRRLIFVVRYFFCFKLVSCVFPTLKKGTNQSTSVTTVGVNVSFYA